MTTLDLLDLLRRKDVKIWAEGGHVRINAPKGTLSADLQAKIHESKEELLRLLHDTQAIGARAAPPIAPSLREDPPPLSFAQERLWFFDRLQPENPAYNISSAFSLFGNLHITTLEQAFRELARRHEVLRTTFPLLDGQPIQKISSASGFVLNRKDVRDLPEKEQVKATRQILKHEANTPFRLGEGPLWKCTVVRQGETRWVLIFVIHHIVADAWSMDIFLRELMILYHAARENRPSPLPQLAVQYGDFVQWQRQERNQKHWEYQRDYWRKQLSGCPLFLELPTDSPRPSIQSFDGSRVPFTISKELTESLKEISGRERATVFMTLLAAFQTLLFRYSGQEDFLVGVPIAGRVKEEVTKLIGLFANTLAFRADLSGSPSFLKLLAQTRRVSLEAFANQDLPFEKVVTALQPERTLSHSPLFQVMFAYQNFSLEGEKVLEGAPGFAIAPIYLEQQTAKFDLTVFIDEMTSGLEGSIEYRTDLFDEETIRRMAGHFEVLLQGIVAQPRQSVSSLPLLTQREKHQVLVEWNATDQPYPNRCLHELFEEQVRRTPNARAVTFEGRHLTYVELNQCANRVAHYLKKAGVGPDVFVGIYLNRSIDMMVSLLGVLKAGGAYVPLDRSFPRERLRLIMAESQMVVLLTQRELSEALPSFSSSKCYESIDAKVVGSCDADHELRRMGFSPQVVCLDTIADELNQESEENLAEVSTPDNLAYVIYTSGSTGAPKGVMVTHRGVVNYLSWACDAYAIEDGIGSLVHTSVGFDMAVTSLFSPLLVGKAVVILPEDAGIDTLAETLVSQHGWSFLKLTPSHLDMLAYRMSGRKPGVKQLIVGGESLRGQIVQNWRSHDPDARIVNEYGPTEATVGCCVYEVPNHNVASDELPIGRPISNVQLYIVDRYKQPVPIGVPGELYIGGHGLARGYLNQPELTRQTFIPNPFGDDPKARLYKTGDRCRYRSNGTIEFLGRMDRQVKLRGFRIELAEVESALSRHSAIEESIVVVNQGSGTSTLSAYLVPSLSSRNIRNGVGQNENTFFSTPIIEIKDFLKEWLPAYMIPSSFLWIDAIPLTINGKIDYEALPKLGAEMDEVKDSFVPPSDTLEAQLVHLWEAALGVKPISIHDNFFDLGGHSLLAVRLWARMESVLGKALPLSLLYRSPTIAQLAQIFRQQGGVIQWEYLVEVQPGGHRLPLFIVPGAGDTGLYLRDLAKYLGSDQPLCGFHAQGLDGRKPFHASVDEMAKQYVHELRRLQPEGPYFLGGYSFGGIVAYEMAQHLQRAGQQVALLALFDTPGPAYRRYSSKNRESEMFLERVHRHVQNLRALTWGSWGQYIGTRLASLWRSLWNRRTREGKWLLCYAWRALGLSISLIPLILRSPYMLYVTSEEAKAAYQVRPYAGQLTIFQAMQSSSIQEGLGWKELALGGFEVKNIAGGHADLMKEPYVQGLALALKECIEKARENPK